MSEHAKYLVSWVLVVGFLIWFVETQTVSGTRAKDDPAAQIDSGRPKPEPPTPRPRSGCDIERDAVQPLLPAVGDTLALDSVFQNYGYPYGKRGQMVATVNQVRTKCYSNGFGVLVQVDDRQFQENKDAPYFLNTSLNLVGDWVKSLIAENYNPRTQSRILTVKTILHHYTSVTGIPHYTLLQIASYSPDTDEIDGRTYSSEIGSIKSDSNWKIDFGSKAALEEFW